MQQIAERLSLVYSRISAACEKSGREHSLIRLIAVSKFHSAGAVSSAFSAGQTLFGENYVQELIDKAEELSLPLEWHFIGHLQSNKVKYLPGIVTLIHTVDRLSVAQEIDRQWRDKVKAPCNVLVQVNVSGEPTKSGTTAKEALDLVRQVSALPFVSVRGLMTMPPFYDDPEGARPFFRELRLLSERISAERITGVDMSELSMGMSGDFEVAIEEGATLIRVGTAIFGER